MQARASLMIEHRLIERMLSVLRDALAKIEGKQKIRPWFVDQGVDFIEVYADRNHHGKEEEILFRDLMKKPLLAEDRQLMNELIEEHEVGRRAAKALAVANTRYRNGDHTALADIAGNFRIFTDLYPGHIEKEDKAFFPASRTYFSDEEDRAILEEFREFDRRMIHVKYKSVVAPLKA